MSIGKHTWAIAEGYIPAPGLHADEPRFASHETACLPNAGERTAQVQRTLYFSDREPVGPYRVEVPARRVPHLRFNDLEDPEPVPRETDYASLFVSDVPIVVQHTRLDGRSTAPAPMTSLAFPG